MPKRDYDERFTVPEGTEADDVVRALVSTPADFALDAEEREAEAEELAESEATELPEL